MNDWPYAAPDQSIPVDRFPNEQTRNEIGLASFEQETQQDVGSRFAPAEPIRTAAMTPPPRDVITAPVSQFAPQTQAPVLSNDFAEPVADASFKTPVVHSGFFSIAGEGDLGAVESSEIAATPSEIQSFDFSSLNNVCLLYTSPSPRDRG